MSQLADQIFDAMKGLFSRSVEPILLRVKALEDRPAAKDGAPGERGEPGLRGEKGEPGERGLPGERGEKGDAGERGERGEQGPVGEVGPQGPAGEKGERGESGERGEKGEPGTAGKDGLAGERGAPGERGEKGESGIDGRDGAEGPAGRDALDLEILSMIDADRRYARGTFAVHRGGLVKAYRATDPLSDDLDKCGWQCIVRGIDREEEELDADGRTMVRRTYYTDGGCMERRHVFSTVVDRGVWREQPYAKADGVTWGGSFYIATKDAPQGKPGECDDWRLAVKRGRDGKDARPDEPKGPPPIVRVK